MQANGKAATDWPHTNVRTLNKAGLVAGLPTWDIRVATEFPLKQHFETNLKVLAWSIQAEQVSDG